MNDKQHAKERGQSLVLVAAALVILVLFVAITVDVSNAYYDKRTAQNAADGAALGGVSQMALEINNRKKRVDLDIKAAMNDYAERNGIEDTTGVLKDAYNNNVVGYYVDTSGNRLPGEPKVGTMLDQRVPDGAYGVEAITYITASTFFGGIFGLDGIPLQARAVSLVKEACGADCVVPIVTQKSALFDPFTGEPLIDSCFNIYSESQFGEPGSYGWVSWTWQELMCADGSRPCPLVEQGPGCDTDVLADNLNPDNCASGYIEYGDWVSNTSGVKNASKKVLCFLDYYLGIPHSITDCGVSSDVPQPFTILVYDETNVGNNTGVCNTMDDPSIPSTGGLHYKVAGFAKMQILGYRLSQGEGVEDAIGGSDGLECITLGVEPHEGNRITAQLLDYVEEFKPDESCVDPTGTLRSSPKIVQ